MGYYDKQKSKIKKFFWNFKKFNKVSKKQRQNANTTQTTKKYKCYYSCPSPLQSLSFSRPLLLQFTLLCLVSTVSLANNSLIYAHTFISKQFLTCCWSPTSQNTPCSLPRTSLILRKFSSQNGERSLRCCSEGCNRDTNYAHANQSLARWQSRTTAVRGKFYMWQRSSYIMEEHLLSNHERL